MNRLIELIKELFFRWKQGHLLDKYSAAAAMAEGGGDMALDYLASSEVDDKRAAELRLEFKTRYHSFKTLLQANNNALENMAAIEKKLQENSPFPFAFVNDKITSISVDVFRMIRNLEEIVPGKYSNLNDSFNRIKNEINSHLISPRRTEDSPLIIPFSSVDLSNTDLVGNKMAKLGEVKNNLHLPVPEGFVVTTYAYELIIKCNDLDAEIGRLFQLVDFEDMESIQKTSQRLQNLILAAKIPPQLESEIKQAISNLKIEGVALRMALRSSALGEDNLKTSFAGQYHSKLNVDEESFLESYKEVVASKYSLEAIVYRYNHGLKDDDILMSVGCLKMLNTVTGGVIYTRNPVDIEDDGIYVESCWGLPKTVVEGNATSDRFVVSREPPYEIIHQDIQSKLMQYGCSPEGGIYEVPVDGNKSSNPSLTPVEIAELAKIATRLEMHFQKPQDIEWGITGDNRIMILQCRPLSRVKTKNAIPRQAETDISTNTILFKGGIAVNPEVTFGEIFKVESREDVMRFPAGAILVTTQALPRWAPLLSRAAGIIVAEGSFAGHLANVSREFGIPALFGVGAVIKGMQNGTLITLDANRREIHSGKIDALLLQTGKKTSLMAGSPVYETLKNISRYIVPLNLIDPDSADFRPSKCTTLHDITRFIHEKSVARMFDFGKTHHFSERSGKQLYYKVPMQWWVLNLDDGFIQETESKYVKLENIASIPMLALWEGMVAVPWEGPPPIDGRGFLSVMFQATTNSSLTASARTGFADKNYFMISKNFCNLSSRLGFHFSTVESIVCDNQEENYISFQFKGGAADFRRRHNRVLFLADILEIYGFSTSIRKDNLIARLENLDHEYMKERLVILGYLLIHTRQIDMIMLNNTAVSYYKSKFEKDINTILQENPGVLAS
ncbi:pyruvate, water dikinase [bacterium]|nr:pyruvate, water dikinase [bacterium]